MRDVARAAGVSVSTVSRVINRSPLVVPETVTHVNRIMTEMGYRLTPAGRSPSKAHRRSGSRSSTKAVCIVLTGHKNLKWITNCAPIYAYAIHGAEAALNERGMTCIIRQVTSIARWEEFKQPVVDGFLILSNDDSKEWPEALQRLPAVKMLGAPSAGWCDYVSYNNDTVGRMAARYFSQKAIFKTAVLGPSGTEVFSARVSAFSQYMRVLGGTVQNLTNDNMLQVMMDSNAPRPAVVRALVDQLLQDCEGRPGGIFVTADVIVPLVYRELERHGVVPGRDITVVSCNNEKPYLSALRSPPAVIDLQAELIGQQAVERLLWRIEHPSAPFMSLIMEPKLIPASETA